MAVNLRARWLEPIERIGVPPWMTIANAAILIGLAGFAVTVTAPHPSKFEALMSTDEEAFCCDCTDSFLPRFYTTSCWDLEDLGDRDECLRVELEDQAVAYTIGAEVYRRPVRLHRLPEPVHWKTLSPPPFVCHVLL